MEKLYQIFLKSSGVSTDTRTISSNKLFFALKGDTFDANTMVAQAFERGAMHVVTTNKDFLDNPNATVVDDTLTTLQQLAAYHRSQLKIPVIGITGTNGKTTTKELIAAVLRKRYAVTASKGNLNNHIGVPLSLLSVGNDTEIAVIEMGASHRGEIKLLASLAKPTAGLITNVGIAHIEGFGSFDGVKATKAELYDQLESTGSTVFINIGNEHLCQMLGDYPNRITYSAHSAADVYGEAIEHAEMLAFRWHAKGGDWHTVSTNMTGNYNIENMLAAIAVGRHFGVDDEKICEAIAEYKPTNSRSQVIQTDRNRVIMDAYNANPSSMAAALDNFLSMADDNKTLILGAMRELGVEQDNQHHEVLSRIARSGINSVYLIGKEYQKFSNEFPDYHYYNTADEAGEDVSALSGRYIMVKGSNSNHLERLKDIL